MRSVWRPTAATLSLALLLLTGCSEADRGGVSSSESETESFSCPPDLPEWAARAPEPLAIDSHSLIWADSSILVVRQCVDGQGDEDMPAMPEVVFGGEVLEPVVVSSASSATASFRDSYVSLPERRASPGDVEVGGQRIDLAAVGGDDGACREFALEPAKRGRGLVRCGMAIRLWWTLTSVPQEVDAKQRLIVETDVLPDSRARAQVKPIVLSTHVMPTSDGGRKLVIDLSRNLWMESKCAEISISHVDLVGADESQSLLQWGRDQGTLKICPKSD